VNVRGQRTNVRRCTQQIPIRLEHVGGRSSQGRADDYLDTLDLVRAHSADRRIEHLL
jgi:hypothetical protein